MDRKQMIVQRACEYLGDRLEDVLHMVRQDRQELRGWQEPAHLRAAVRRIVQEAGRPLSEVGQVVVEEVEFGRTAGEPDRGQQREAIGGLLESGAVALEKISRNAPGEITLRRVIRP